MKGQMTDCIIFDFDGTIADTSAGIIATTQEAFRQLGFPEITEEQIRPTIGLVLEQSLQRGNLPLPVASTSGKEADWREFLTRLECGYVAEMRRFLRGELGVEAAITDTQINWPGLTSIESQRDMDYVDVHSYWGHPRFLNKGKAWDFTPGNWEIDPAGSAIPSLAKRGWNPMEEAARYRFHNKPLVISEFDYHYPQLFAAEMMPLFATVFCRQDWDALHLFIHGRVPGNRGTEGVNHMFDQTNHPGKIGFFPAAALIYRRHKTKKVAMAALAVSVVIAVIGAVFINCFLTIPTYAIAFGGMENIIAMGTAVNPAITNLYTFAIFAIVPFNLLKCSLNALVTVLVYKRISVILHAERPVNPGKASVKG